MSFQGVIYDGLTSRITYPKVFLPPPDTGLTSSHNHASCLYAFHERRKASLTATLRSELMISCSFDEVSNSGWTRGSFFAFPLGRGVIDTGGKYSLASVQLKLEGTNCTRLVR